jgi:hypothetical protein
MAGISAMNGDAVRAIAEMNTIAARTPGSRRQARPPVRMRLQVEPSPWGRGTGGSRRATSAASIAANEAVLSANAAV